MSNPKELAEKWFAEHEADGYNRLTVFLAGYNAANEWVKCSERLPEKYTVVLVWTKDGEIKLDQAVNEVIETSVGYSWKNSNRTRVTHWLPLPEKPKS